MKNKLCEEVADMLKRCLNATNIWIDDAAMSFEIEIDSRFVCVIKCSNGLVVCVRSRFDMKCDEKSSLEKALQGRYRSDLEEFTVHENLGLKCEELITLLSHETKGDGDFVRFIKEKVDEIRERIHMLLPEV